MFSLANKLTLLGLLFSIAYKGGHALPNKRESNSESGPLYGSSGLPMAEDVEYHHYDQGYSAAVIAATKFPQFLKSLIQYDGDNFTSISKVNATVFKTDSVESSTHVITHGEISERNNTRGDVWWPGALYRASLRSGYVIDPDGKMGMPNLQPKDAMILLSGYSPDFVRTFDKESLWNHLTIDNKLNSTFYNPMVCRASDDAETLVGGMTYVINEPLDKQRSSNSRSMSKIPLTNIIVTLQKNFLQDLLHCWEWNLERFVKPWLAVGDDNENTFKDTSSTTSTASDPSNISADTSSATSTQGSSSKPTSSSSASSSDASSFPSDFSSEQSTTASSTSSGESSTTSTSSQS
ncbi:hypothetical protein I203_107919 [Kwoniella mangroviensis CBS 8507]|uniref:hypothetical protein n=1 Tax=Kwoniella mangroviensis CBS 8507 TaxID=1296122 RepID=UPI003040AECA